MRAMILTGCAVLSVAQLPVDPKAPNNTTGVRPPPHNATLPMPFPKNTTDPNAPPHPPTTGGIVPPWMTNGTNHTAPWPAPWPMPPTNFTFPSMNHTNGSWPFPPLFNMTKPNVTMPSVCMCDASGSNGKSGSKSKSGSMGKGGGPASPSRGKSGTSNGILDKIAELAEQCLCLAGGSQGMKAPPRQQCAGGVANLIEDEKSQCCTQKNVGCQPPARYNCNGTAVEVSTWEEDRQRYCCEREMVGCDFLEMPVFDCQWVDAEKPWTKNHAAYCCEKENQRCPDADEVKSEEEKETCRRLEEASLLKDTTAEMTQKCCRGFDKGCASEHDCFSDTDFELWDAKKRTFCCRDKDVGCAWQCDNAAVEGGELLEDQADFCCETKGMCTDAWHAAQEQMDAAEEEVEKQAGRAPRKFRIKIEGSAEELLGGPKKLLALYRWAIMTASPELMMDPSLFDLEHIGVLMANLTVPPKDKEDKWGVRCPRSWNKEMHGDENNRTHVHKKNVASRYGAALATSSSGMYVDYTLDPSATTAAADIAAQTATGTLGDGSGQDLNVIEGQQELVTLVTDVPANSSTSGTFTSESDDSSSSKNTTIAIIAAVIATIMLVLIVILVVFTCRRKQQQQKQEEEMGQQQKVKEMEEWTPSSRASGSPVNVERIEQNPLDDVFPESPKSGAGSSGRV